MFNRIKFLFRSILGWFITIGEDPDIMLSQLEHDLRDTVPKMRELVVAAVTAEKKLELQVAQEKEKISRAERQLQSASGMQNIKPEMMAALQNVAIQLSNSKQTLQMLLTELGSNEEGNMSGARQVSYEAKRDLEAYELKAKGDIMKCQRLKSMHSAAQAKAALASQMAAFKPTDNSHIMARVEERVMNTAAAANAKLEVARDSSENQGLRLQMAAAQSEASDILAQYGIGSKPATKQANVLGDSPVQGLPEASIESEVPKTGTRQFSLQ